MPVNTSAEQLSLVDQSLTGPAQRLGLTRDLGHESVRKLS
jgi:hypothetical protein